MRKKSFSVVSVVNVLGALVVAASFFVSETGFANETFSPLGIIGSGGPSLPSDLSPEGKFGCKLAAFGRLSNDSARGSCEPGNTMNKGASPPANDFCQAPTTSTGKTQTEISQQTGKEAKYSQEAPRCALKGSEIDNVPNGKTDCSGYVSGVLMRAGARLKPGQPLKEPMTTAQLLEIAKGDSCWRQVMGPPMPGDMCFYNNGSVGHVWLIGRVNRDNPSNYSRMESTNAEVSGIQETVSGGASSDSSAGGCGRDGKPSAGVHHMRFEAEKAGCTDPDAQTRKFKDEDRVASCDVGGK